MLRMRSIRVGSVILAAVVFAWARPSSSLAQRTAGANSSTTEADAQYADWVATYGRWSPAQAEQAGYLPTDVCVTASSVGLPAATGAMGRHFVRPDYVEDGKADADAPEIVLFDANDRVAGLEFVIPTVVDPIPSVGGVSLAVTPPDPGIDEEHLSLHVYFVGDPADRHATFNPAVDCGTGAGSDVAGVDGDGDAADGSAAAGESAAGDSGAVQPKLKPAPELPSAMPAASDPDAAGATEAVTATSTTGAMTETVAAASMPGAVVVGGGEMQTAPPASAQPAAPADDTESDAPGAQPADAPVAADLSTMPVAGAGDLLPGGDATLFGGLAGLLVLLAAAGWWTAMRRA